MICAILRDLICYLLVYARCYGDARLPPCGKRAFTGLFVVFVAVQAAHMLVLVQGLGVGFAAGRSGEEKAETC